MARAYLYEYRSPLDWPADWPRAKHRAAARFDARLTIHRAIDELLEELGRLGATEVELTSHAPARSDLTGPLKTTDAFGDPGVSAWFHLPTPDGKSARPAVLACDRWLRVAHNLRAITRHVGALRGQERWGVGSLERAFSGYLALPPPAAGPPARPWREVLGLEGAGRVTLAAIATAWKSRVRHVHPDLPSGDEQAYKELNRARAAALEAVVSGRGVKP